MGALSSPDVLARRWKTFTPFDRLVAGILALLLGAVILTVLLGDRVGVTLERVAPLGEASSTATILLQFSETMNRETLPDRLRLLQVPPDRANDAYHPGDELAEITGSITWSGRALIFRPSSALLPGATYQVLLEPGALSDQNRRMLAEQRFSFVVKRPRLAYLSPANASPFNIWLADPADPAGARQVTFSPSGIYDFGVSPDGSRIAFSERDSNTGTMDIKLLDLASGAIEQLTNCLDAECKTPIWRPDGLVIAYERIDYNTGLGQVGVSPTRIWLLDLTTRPATTRPMFSDSQRLGFGLQWSRDGQRVTVFDYNNAGILMHDFRDDTTVVIPSKYGNPGQLSPDGNRIVFPEVVLDSSEARSYLQMVDLSTQSFTTLTDPNDPIDDDTAVWSPDGKWLALGRRYTDQRYTRGKQIYLLNPDDGSVIPLVVDPQYQNGFFSWDPTGDQIAIQRFPDAVAMNQPDNPGLPQIWVFDLSTKRLDRVADNAFNARWVP